VKIPIRLVANTMSEYRPSTLWRLLREFAARDALYGFRTEASERSVQTLPMRVNSVLLMTNFIVSAGMGYPFWILAARLFDANDVGVGSAALSGMRLCTLLATLGIGSAIVMLLPKPENRPSDVLSAAFTLATSTGLAIAAGFLILSRTMIPELGTLTESPADVLAFMLLIGTVLLATAFDSTFMALRRADSTLARSVIQGVTAIVILLLVALLLDIGGVMTILLAWIGSLAASALVGYLHLHAMIPGVRLRPSFSWAPALAVLRVSVPNFILRLAIGVPVQVVPLIVVAVLSPAANAYWRAVWIFGLLVLTVPNSSSSALFAEGANAPEKLDEDTRKSLQLSFALGIPAAIVVALFADIGLGLMGADYAEAGATPLRILVITLIPQTFIAAYIARQRVTNRLLEPTLFGVLSSALSIIGALIGGALFGLPGVAIAWLAAQSVLGSWALWKILPVLIPGRSSTQPESSTEERSSRRQSNLPSRILGD
jgi:O-antigen/teichoic acid export membrane protein